MRSSDVRAAIALAYRQPEWATFFEVADGTGMNKRRSADAVAVNMWPSRGLAVNGFEIKVDRSDWRRELADPEKAESIARFCDFWWVAAPKDLIDPKTLPSGWGLTEVLDDGKMRIRVQAKEREGIPVTRSFFAALCRSKAAADESTVKALVEEQIRRTQGDRDARIASAVAAKTREAEALVEQHAAFARAVAKFELRGVTEEKLVEAITLVQKLGLLSDWNGIKQIARSLRATTDQFEKQLKEIGLCSEK